MFLTAGRFSEEVYTFWYRCPGYPSWARVVKTQNLPWTNVCDFRGSASPYAGMYNIAALPATFLIKDGELVDGQAVDEKAFRKLIEKLLK